MTTTPQPEESADLRSLRHQVEDLERALEAIRSGHVDALVVGGGGEVQLYHRITNDRPYRVLVEQMAAGLATLSPDGRLLFANERLAEWLRCPRESLVGQSLQDLVLTLNQPALALWLAAAAGGTSPRPLVLRRSDGVCLPVLAALTAVEVEAEPIVCLVAIADSRVDGPHELPAAPQPPPIRGFQGVGQGHGSDLKPTSRQRQNLALTVGCLVVIFVLDLLLPRSFVLQPFLWLPLVLAATFARPRQLLILALMVLTLLLLSGLRWAMLAELEFWLRVLATLLFTSVSMVLVIQRQQQQERRRASAERYRTVAENAADVVFRASLEGVTEWITPSVTAMIGWRPDEIIGRPFGPFVHPEDLPHLLRADAGFARGERMEFRLRVRRPEGGYHWVEVVGRGALDASGAVVGIVGSWRDIQSLVEAEQARDRERARLVATVDSLLDPHVVLRARRDAAGAIVDFIYVEANQAACHYNLLSRGQLLGKGVMELLPAHSSSGLLELYSRVVETGDPLTLDDFVYPHEILGEERHYDIRAVPMGEELSFTWRDVTDRVDAQQRLAASEEAYRLLAQNSSDVVLRIRDDRILWISPSLQAALGWEPQEWLGRPVTEPLHPDDQAAYATARQAIERGQSVVSSHRVRAKDGSWHWIEAHAGPYRDPQGTIDGLVASFRIVDSEVAAREQLERYARTDELTGLLNRREVLERIDGREDHQVRTGEQTALLFCDLDRFKTINDRFGHAAGDELLRTVARRIRSCLRSEDLAARTGGDELLVVLHGVQDLANAVAIAEKIRTAVAHPVPTAAGDLKISLSIGVTLALPGESSDALIARADAAMYEAKQFGRDRVIAIQ